MSNNQTKESKVFGIDEVFPMEFEMLRVKELDDPHRDGEVYCARGAVGNYISNLTISMMHRIVCDRTEFIQVNFAVIIKDSFVCTNIDNLTYKSAGFFIIADVFTFKCHR